MHLFLTEEGTALNRYVEAQSDQKMQELLAPLNNEEQQQLVQAMKTIEKILYQVVPNELEE
jgi:DNA-binding MarR family transcriptional regulator